LLEVLGVFVQDSKLLVGISCWLDDVPHRAVA
jgi:hypothetical protein